MSEKYYLSKWDNLSNVEKYKLSKESENKLAKYLIENCGFKQIIPSRDSIITISNNETLILPDLQGKHKNGNIYFIELKDKNRRMFFNDNGIDYDKAEAYLKVQDEFGIKVLIVFLDNENEWIIKYPDVFSWFKDENFECTYYGNWIEKLHYETPENIVTITTGTNDKKVKCFPLKNMKKIIDIFKERQTQLNLDLLK